MSNPLNFRGLFFLYIVMRLNYYSLQVQKTKKSSPVLIRYFDNAVSARSFFRFYCDRDVRKKIPSYRVYLYEHRVFDSFIRVEYVAVKVRLPKKVRESNEELPF